MSRQLTDTLKALQHQRKMETVKKGWGSVPDWVFISGEGMWLDACNWRNRVFNKALE